MNEDITMVEPQPGIDNDPSNVLLRAGYLIGMAARLPEDSDDRMYLIRASRSLRAFAQMLQEGDAEERG